MERVFSFTPADILVWCGAIITISGAVAVLVKLYKAAEKPNEEQNNRITALEQRVDNHDALFRNDNNRLKAIEDGNRVTQKALLALLDHGIDGNNVAQMQQAKIDLQNHLIER